MTPGLHDLTNMSNTGRSACLPTRFPKGEPESRFLSVVYCRYLHLDISLLLCPECSNCFNRLGSSGFVFTVEMHCMILHVWLHSIEWLFWKQSLQCLPLSRAVRIEKQDGRVFAGSIGIDSTWLQCGNFHARIPMKQWNILWHSWRRLWFKLEDRHMGQSWRVHGRGRRALAKQRLRKSCVDEILADLAE